MRSIIVTLFVFGGLLAPVNAQAADLCDADLPPSRGTWTFNGEYVMWWLRRGYLPPVLTTSPTTSQGILGRPGTQVIYGDERLSTRHDNRFFGTRFSAEWTEPEKCFGFEGRAFFLERDSTYFTLKHRPAPLMALSYIDANTGQEASEVISGSSQLRGDLLGGFVGYSRIELFGQEANFVVPLAESSGGKLDLLVGGRFLQLRDRYHHTATNYTLPDRSILTGVVDNIRVHNAFYGGQLGLRGEWRWNQLFLQARGAVAIGADDQLVRTFGERVYHTPQERIVTPRGLFIQPSNTGSYSRCHFDAFGEVGANLGWQLTSWCRTFVGYTYFWWADPLRAATQLDRVVNVQQPATTTATQPGIPFKGDTFWGHGLNVGLEFKW